jgi:ATP-dependent Zn protease
MKISFFLILLFSAFLSNSLEVGASGKFTEESLIQAWEEIQKSDPQTITFEKLEGRRYKFKTKRFPFDGELKILNAVINDDVFASRTGFNTGEIEYDLIGLTKDVEQKYRRSFSLWESNNKLYYDKSTDEWLSSRTFRRIAEQKMQSPEEGEGIEKEKKTSWIWGVISWVPIVVILGMWLFLMRKMNLKKNRDYMTKAEEHLELANAHMKRVEEMMEKIVKAVEKNEHPQM